MQVDYIAHRIIVYYLAVTVLESPRRGVPLSEHEYVLCRGGWHCLETREPCRPLLSRRLDEIRTTMLSAGLIRLGDRPGAYEDVTTMRVSR